MRYYLIWPGNTFGILQEELEVICWGEGNQKYPAATATQPQINRRNLMDGHFLTYLYLYSFPLKATTIQVSK